MLVLPFKKNNKFDLHIEELKIVNFLKLCILLGTLYLPKIHKSKHIHRKYLALTLSTNTSHLYGVHNYIIFLSIKSHMGHRLQKHKINLGHDVYNRLINKRKLFIILKKLNI